MAAGYSLHVGVNSPAPGRFGDLHDLHGCDTAAQRMGELARARSFRDVRVRTDRGDTTCGAVAAWFSDMAKIAVPGDLVLFTFAGHGVQVNDVNHDEGQYDQAILCTDGGIVDDTIHDWLAAFQSGVRVVLIADSCYSGSIVWFTFQRRLMRSTALASRHSLWFGLAKAPKVAADVLLLAAVDDQTLATGAAPGQDVPPYTQALLDAWNQLHGEFSGGYREWSGMTGGVLNLDLLNHEQFADAQPLDPNG